MTMLEDVRILAIDDEPDMLEVIGALLRSRGAEVRCFSSAQAALAEIDAFAPHVVLSDLSMPGMDGIAFVQRLRQVGGSMPAIALSALTDPAWKLAALGAGFQSFVQKPFEPDQLSRTIAKLAGTAGA